MLHVTAAFFFVGAGIAATIFNVLAVRTKRPSEAAALLRLIRRVLPLMFVGMAGTLLLGIWLWHHQGYSLGTAWIWGSLALWVLSGALGGRGGAHQERARELAERLAAEGDTPNDELRAILADPKGSALSYAAGVATLGILVLMIWKP
jgi:uncharacterized membrane protein